MKRLLLLASAIIVLQTNLNGQAYETRSYDLPSSTKHATLTAAEQKETSVIITEKLIYEYLYDKDGDLESYYTRHRRVHINDEGDVEHFNRIYFPINDPSDLLALKLRTVSKSGKVTEMFKGDLKKITEDGRDYMVIAVEGLEKDAELEYFYTMRRGVTYFITEYAQMGVLIRNAEVKLISPENLIWEAKTYNGEMKRADTVIVDKRFLTFTRENVPVLDSEEKYAAYTANRLRIEFKLSKNTSGSNLRLFTWGDAGKRYYESMHEQEKSAKKDIEKLASSLSLKKMANDELRIRAVENYMKTNVNINEEEADPTIGNMLKKHYGSENQVVSLYILMFEYLNIPTELVVTSSRYDAFFDPDFDTWNFLDSYLIYFPSTGKYMDPSNFLYRYGLIPFEYIGNNGLFIKKVSLGEVSNGVSSVKKIEGFDYKDSYNNMYADITFENNLSEVKVKVKHEYNGFGDNLVRSIYFYSDEEARTKLVDELLESSFKDMKATGTKITNYDLVKDDCTKPLILETTVTSKSLIENAGENIVFSIGDVIGQQVEMYQDHARQNPIDVSFPHYYERVLTVNIPAGYTVKGLEKLNMNIVFEDKGVGFTSSYKQEGSKIIVTINEYYKKIQLPVSAFEDFKKVINAAADFNKIKLVLTKS